jgi:ketosteroid isomerase-like protein
VGEAENVELVRAMYDAVNRAGRWDAVLDYVSPEIELETDPRHPSAGVYRGLDRYRRFLDEFEEPYEHTTMEPEHVFAKGDQVVTYVLAKRRPRGSSTELERRVGFLWTVRDGRIVREQVFGDREQALEAAGMKQDDEVAVTT